MNPCVVLLLVSVGVSPIVAVRREQQPVSALGNFPFELDWGPCPNARTVQNFNPRKFAGTWYDVQRYKNTVLTGKCGSAVFTWNQDSQMLNFTYSNLDSSEYMALTPIDLGDGMFRLLRDGREMPVDFLLLDTDYVNYAVTWTCLEVLYGTANTQTLHIWGRTPTLSPQVVATATNVITSRKLSLERLQNVAQRENTCRRDSDY